jgi:tetratricopeptide (TPR) repeat protein
MSRAAVLLACVFLLGPWCAAQVEGAGSGRGKPPEGAPPPRSDPAGALDESSSRQTQIDLSPPDNDWAHAGPEPTGVGEFKKYDPHRADKDLEVGDYYAKQGNYRGALLRYQDALDYKPNDPTAIFRLAETYERTEQPRPAARYTVLYLRLAPTGEFADAARKLQQRLRPQIEAEAATPEQKRAFTLVDEGAEVLSRHDFRGAIARFQQALGLDPTNEDATFFLADAYEQNGQMEEAGAAYRVYLRLAPGGTFADASRIALEHLPALRGEGIPAKPELPTSLPSETPR